MHRTWIDSIGTAVPPKSYTQDEIFAMAGYKRRAIQAIFRNSAIERRHMALEPHYKPENDPNWFSRHYAEWAPRLAEEAAREALAQAGLEPSKIDFLAVTSCTGYLCPGLSQLTASRLGLHPRAKTANLVGMGCNAAVPALERASEFARLNPGKHALVVSVEVCSATYWVDDDDVETAVGNAIFADGASAAVVRAGEAPGLVALEAFATRSNRELLNYMGFRNRGGRLSVMLDRDVPEAVLPLCEQAVGDLLAERHLGRGDVARWVLHPGGRRVLETIEGAWKLKGKLQCSWNVLARYGNLSSATILYVLREHLLERAKAQGSGGTSGEAGVLLAMGPGLSVEGALLRFPG